MHEWEKRWREANADIVRAHAERSSRKIRLAQYGLTEKQFQAMLKKQKGLCAICSTEMNPPNIDHDHTTGRVRKLLCKHCNWGLGQFKDDPRLLAYALVYLEEHGKRGMI